MINPSQHTLNEKVVTSRITWMGSVSYQHHGNIQLLNNHDNIKNHPFNENCYNLKLVKDSVFPLSSWER